MAFSFVKNRSVKTEIKPKMPPLEPVINIRMKETPDADTPIIFLSNPFQLPFFSQLSIQFQAFLPLLCTTLIEE